jgi:hypothetical protein
MYARYVAWLRKDPEYAVKLTDGRHRVAREILAPNPTA